MLKVLFVLGCLLSLILAQPIDTAPEQVALSSEMDTAPERVARSSEGLNSATRQLLLQILINLIRSQQTATTAAATTAAATTAAPGAGK